MKMDELKFENEVARKLFNAIYTQMDIESVPHDGVITEIYAKTLIEICKQRYLKRNVVLVPLYNVPMI